MERDGRLRLFIDVGTNCEIALGSRDRLLSTAAPAGPAFEAAQIRCGMRAAGGAIETVRIGDDGLVLGVIGDEEPVGLCGSGLVDTCAELVRVGLLDGSGRLLDRETALERVPALADRLAVLESGERVFVLQPGPEGGVDGGVFLCQRDVRELQFAKASIATGWTPARARSSASTRATSSRCCSRARSAPTSRQLAPCASASCRRCR